MDQAQFTKLSWGIFFSSLLLAFVAWGSSFAWDFSGISSLSLFPLFGIVAWLVMAGHYVTGTLRIKNPELQKPAYYKKTTGYTVLASLLLHPIILISELRELGFGTPPDSFVLYVGEGLKLAVMLGSLSLFLFLSFEVLERIRTHAFITKIWKGVSVSQSLAMTLIWVHGLELGSALGQTWFRIVWVLIGLALLPCFYFIHEAEFKKS